MRILRIADIAEGRTGGMARVLHCTGDRMRAMGHQVDDLFRKDLPIAGPASLRQRLLLPIALPRIVRQRIRAGQSYDVVEIHEPIAAPYCFLRSFWPELPPAVVFSHGLEQRHQQAELAYRHQQGLPISLPLRYLRLTVLQSNYAIRHCQQLICLNTEDATCAQQIGLPATRISPISNGVEEVFLAAGRARAAEKLPPPNLLFMGAWILRKGIRELVAAVSPILQQHPQVTLTIAGCGQSPETILSAFANPLQAQITVIPHLASNEALIDLYRQHSILVLPSYFEGQPLVMLEAAAMGLAIVTTQTCGMADFITPDGNGLLIPIGDALALESCLKRLVETPALIHQLGSAAQLTVQSYTWQRSAEMILTAYQRAIEVAHPVPHSPANHAIH